jgi:hypothetical protein
VLELNIDTFMIISYSGLTCGDTGYLTSHQLNGGGSWYPPAGTLTIAAVETDGFFGEYNFQISLALQIC